jgi:catechol 2,3-dioxygenase-like lactoylglutathione lyase family enzyme
MHQPMISSVGHISMFVHGLEKRTSFYRDVLGLQVADRDPDMGIDFMSSEPQSEHHQLVLL